MRLTLRCASRFVAFLLYCGLAAPAAWGAYNCNVTVSNLGVLYSATANVDAVGSVTLNCTRDPLVDAASMQYRVKAALSTNSSGNTRRVWLGSPVSNLDYELKRGGTCAGGGATDWTDANNRSIQGTLTFTGPTATSVPLPFCVRVSPQGNPAGGLYTDTSTVYAEYNASYGQTTAAAYLTYTVATDSRCLFNTQPGNITLNYTSGGTAQSMSTSFDLRCSTGVGWSVSISPATATLLGLNYTMSATPSSGAGSGNTSVPVTVTATMDANQSGTCTTATCTGTQSHTVTITY